METVRSHRCRGIPPDIPDAWQQCLTPLQPELKQAKEAKGTNASDKTIYFRADHTIVDCYKAANFNKISEMTSSSTEPIPKQGDKETCLKWAPTSQCSNKCTQSAAHLRYQTKTNKAIHAHMDSCGVPKQE